MAYGELNGHVTDDIRSVCDQVKVMTPIDTLRAQYLENSWRQQSPITR